MAFNRAAPSRLTAPVREAAMSTVARALEYFEKTYGPYPMDELTVVTLKRRFSQGYLGYITLTDSIAPCVSNNPLRSSSVAEKGRFPT